MEPSLVGPPTKKFKIIQNYSQGWKRYRDSVRAAEMSWVPRAPPPLRMLAEPQLHDFLNWLGDSPSAGPASVCSATGVPAMLAAQHTVPFTVPGAARLTPPPDGGLT